MSNFFFFYTPFSSYSGTSSIVDGENVLLSQLTSTFSYPIAIAMVAQTTNYGVYEEPDLLTEKELERER